MISLALILAAAPLTLARHHTAGQQYAVEYTNEDTQLKVSKTFKGTVTAKSATTFEVSVDSLEWTSASGKKSASGVKLSVEVNGDSIDAEVVSAGTAGGQAEMELTAFEHLLGDMCQPPKGPFTAGKKVGDWELVSVTGTTAKLKSKPKPKGDPFTCDVTLSTEDGFAGERRGLMQVQLDPKTRVEQIQTLKVKKL